MDALNDKAALVSEWQRMMDAATRHEEMMRIALGPLDDFRHASIADMIDSRRQIEACAARLGTLDVSAARSLANPLGDATEAIRRQIDSIGALTSYSGLPETNALLGQYAASDAVRRQLEDFEMRFRVPSLHETAQSFLHQLEGSSVVEAARHMQEKWQMPLADLQKAMDAIHQPWLDACHPINSFSGFAELQNIGYALRTLPVFGDDLAEQLRAALGDWQSPLDIATDTLTDSLARSDFYLARGLDPALTNFPAPIFFESTSVAGLQPLPPRAVGYSTRTETCQPNDEEQAFKRTNAAHDRLMRFETQVRRFIDERMTSTIGPKWVKQRVPEPIKKNWAEKRDKAVAAGEEELPLIAYADFTDYAPIITRKDNWDEVFVGVFNRITLVQESFQRLYPIRICTMHARLITQDDELYLLVEVKRLLTAMGISLH